MGHPPEFIMICYRYYFYIFFRVIFSNIMLQAKWTQGNTILVWMYKPLQQIIYFIPRL